MSYLLIPADVAEIKRVTTTDTYLHTLHKYTNYSIQVLAFTNAGDGKRSPPVFCMTEEDGNKYIVYNRTTTEIRDFAYLHFITVCAKLIALNWLLSFYLTNVGQLRWMLAMI